MSASVVRFESASKTYHSGPFWAHSATDALHPTDFEIGPEEMVAMVGESGSGRRRSDGCASASLSRQQAGCSSRASAFPRIAGSCEDASPLSCRTRRLRSTPTCESALR